MGTKRLSRCEGPSVSCIVGGQYGSEGKGAICGYLANEFDVAVRVGAPNAGHTLKMGEKVWKMQQIPVAGLVNPDCVLLIGAAGLINMNVLRREMGYIKDLDGRFFIDRNAGVLESRHQKQEEDEKMFEGIGSTCEGVGAALRDKIERRRTSTQFRPLFRTAKEVPELKKYIINIAEYINNLPDSKTVMIEGTQGFALSMNHGPYPYTTSRDVIASSLLSDVGISPFSCNNICMVVRTYPIRVAGNSGILRNEVDWDIVTKESGSPEQLMEQTTVTKRIRRVGRFDMRMVREAVALNKPTHIALTFADYLTHKDYGKTEFNSLSEKTLVFIEQLEEATKTPVMLIKTGPDYSQIIDRRLMRD